MEDMVAKTTISAPAEDLAEIDRRARGQGMSRSRYLIFLGLGKDLPFVGAETLSDRVEVLERQLAGACKNLELLGLPVDGGVV